VLLVEDIVAGYILPSCGRVFEAVSRPLRLILRLLLPFGRGLPKYVLKSSWPTSASMPVKLDAVAEIARQSGLGMNLWGPHVMIILNIHRAS